MMAGYCWPMPAFLRPRSTRGCGGCPVAVLGCGEFVGKLRQRDHKVREVPGRASLLDGACLCLDTASAIVAFLEAWLHWKSHCKSFLLLTVSAPNSGHPVPHGTPLNVQRVLFPQRPPLRLPILSWPSRYLDRLLESLHTQRK